MALFSQGVREENEYVALPEWMGRGPLGCLNSISLN